MAKMNPDLQAYADDGLRLCRAGDWNKGLPVLAAVLEQRSPMDQVPGLVYSYLGYGVARYQGKIREGIKLCEHAIKIQYYECENHWNLARIQALAGERMNAHQTIERGLKLDPTHDGLLATQRELGVRRAPVLKFLARSNPINVFLGRMRHQLLESRAAQAETARSAKPAAAAPSKGGAPPRPPGARPATPGAATPGAAAASAPRAPGAGAPAGPRPPAGGEAKYPTAK
jgi:tetratricopeptide (TPR) repeat protein